MLADYLAQEHACYGKQAILVTEFGAEANRAGPVDERGTYEFQSQFLGAQLAEFAATTVAQRRDLLGAAGLPRAARLDRRLPGTTPSARLRRLQSTSKGS